MKLIFSSLVLLLLIDFINCGVQDSRSTPPSKDAQNLHEAMVGIGTNEERIIHILSELTYAQRELVAKEYLKLYNKDLLQDFKNELSGNLLKTVKALMRNPNEVLAKEVKRALTSVITEDDTLAEILCTRTRNELLPIMEAYQKRYNKTLLSQLDESLEGDQRTFYKAIITEKIRGRGGEEVSVDQSKNEVNIIPNVADYCTVPQNQALMQLFAKATFEHINFVSVLHEQAKNKKIEEQLAKWCADDGLTKGYTTVVRYARDPIQYYAEELRKAMAGVNPLIEIGTNDDKLIRIIVTHCEFDLKDIKNKYLQIYNKNLGADIEGETSGDYKNLLLKIISKCDSWRH